MKRKAALTLTQTLLDFDLEESSSDSDFRIEDYSDKDSQADKDTDDSDDEGSDDDDSGEGSDDDSDSDSDKGGQLKNAGGGGGEEQKHMSVEKLLAEAAKSHSMVALDDKTKTLLAIPICFACLGDRSDDSNEIVECDGCGVTVHEGCYGVSDSTSISSTVSSCSTEPWFCEACKAGISEPECELCPNKGGIYKETDVGKWVHLVCALYVPGVAFGEVDQLSSVTLFEMPYNKWGAKTCSLCEDARFACTGVCIGCDAGMCKTFFHVTCAQSAGLLSEPHSEEADHADPFYAHCKIHSDKNLIKHRKRNFHALRLQMLSKGLAREQRALEEPKPEHVRIDRKLKKHKNKYLANKINKNDPWVPTQKMPRLLTTSASACKKLIVKAELMGIDAAAMEFQEAQMTALADIRKKWHIPPAFSVEFIGYYLDRIGRLKDLKTNLQDQLQLNKTLTGDQQSLRDKYEERVKLNESATAANAQLRAAVEKLHAEIRLLCPNKQLPVIDQIGKPATAVVNTTVPPIAGPPAPSVPPRKFVTAAALKMGVGFPLNNLIAPGGKDDTGRILSTQSTNKDELLNECGICKQQHQQHLLAKCDTCFLYYHLGCLNPPLTRHPKKSKLYGWQCSECDKSDDSGPEAVLIPKAPRRSRTRYSKDGILICDPPMPPTEAVDVDGGVAGVSVVDESAEKKVKTPIKSPVRKVSQDTVEVSKPKLGPKKAGRKPGRPSLDPLDPLEISDADKKKIIENSFKITVNVDMEKNELVKFPAAKSPALEPVSPKKTATTPLPPIETIDLSTDPLADSSAATTPASATTKTKSIKKSKKDKHKHQQSSMGGVGDPVTPTYYIYNPPSDTSAQFTSELVDGTSSSGGHRKHKKDKHKSKRSSSDEHIASSKEHKRKRKRKNHDMENPNDRVGSATTSVGDTVPHPRILIKFKAIPPPIGVSGAGATGTGPQFFYVPSEDVVLSPARPMEICRPAVVVEKKDNETVPPSPVKVTPAPATTTPAKIKKSRLSIAGPSPKRAKKEDSTPDLVCCVCQLTGNVQNLVRCDECTKNYHFHCLDPPLKKTPKKRGYSWHCADCDPTDVEQK